MKIKFTLILLTLLIQTVIVTAQIPADFSMKGVNSIQNKNFNISPNAGQKSGSLSRFSVFANNASLTDQLINCSDSDILFAPNAAPCNGVSVTSINFLSTSRTIASGTDNTTGVVYRYANAGTAPDGTSVDAYVTVVSYSNNMDANLANFSSADVVGDETTTNGYDRNLQPNIIQESGTYTNAGTWTGSIQYRINFYQANTAIPVRLTVAATSIDNDGAAVGTNGCAGALQESVTYSGVGSNRILINTPSNTTQTVSGATVQGPAVNQSGIGVGSNYANAALLVNVSQFDWTYSFNAPTTTCANGESTGSARRLGSLNLTCQITFDQEFDTVNLSGNVFNDLNGLIGTPANTVDGTGTNISGALYANLLDGSGIVIDTVAVGATGTYSFSGVPTGVSYTVQITSSNSPTVFAGNAAQGTTLPAGWVNTGENIGATAGNDGTPNGLITIPTIAANAADITNVNFGIEQRPTANNNVAASQTNPGGTTNVTVPATTFSAADPAGGTVSSIRITAFPSGATSITVNGVNYTFSNFPAGGITVPTDASGNPTQTILVDPSATGITSVVIPYVAIDNAGVASLTPATATVPFGGLTISGNVFNDLNGLIGTPANTVDGTGTNTGAPLYANLLNSSGVVVGVAAVAANGTYTLAGATANTNYTVQISTNQGTVGAAAPATALPAGWVNTGENLGAGAGSDGTVNGQLAVAVATTSVTNANFGIEQRPVANNATAATRPNPGGTTSSAVAATSFTAGDFSGGTVSSIRITALPTGATSITVGATTYTSANFPAGGITITTNASGNPTQAISVDPSATGNTTVVIPYVAIDNAGVESAAAAVTVPFGPAGTATISGSVFNDIGGLTDGIVNGTGTDTGSTLYVVLVNGSGNVVQSVTVASNGAYAFPGVATGSYTVRLSTTAGTVGAAAPAASLPSGWVNTGENIGTNAGNDGTANGQLAVTVPATPTDVTNVNFGIEQPPTANNNTAASRVNPGGTTSVTVPATTFSATDSSNGTVTSIRITQFPTGATSITINGVNYTSANFPGGGVTIPTDVNGRPTQPILVDPAATGNTSVLILYRAIDNAGIESATATGTVPFTLTPTSGAGNISGTLFSGGTPIRNALVVLVDGASNAKTFTRTDANGKYTFEGKPVGRTYIIEPLSSKYSFSPTVTVVNLLDSAVGQNFESSAKNYRPKNDFDGDGKTDAVVFRPTDGNWYVRQSSDGQMSVFNFGSETDRPVSADFDGDGKTDYAVFRPSTGIWYIWQSATQNLRAEQFGLSTDKLVPADYDGDGKADVAIYRGGVWYIRRSSDNAYEARSYGNDTDTPITGDFDADGKADFSVYRSAEGIWFTLKSSNGESFARRFGVATDIPMAADFDGDGTDDIAQFRNGTWYVLNSTTQFEASQFGTSADRSIVGDFDGDGRADTTIFGDEGLWSIRNSGNGTLTRFYFGLPTDIAVQ